MIPTGNAFRFFAIGVLAAAAAMTSYEFVRRLPENWKPWGDIELDQEPTWFARWQISRLDDNSELCFAALDRSEMQYRRLPDRSLREGCGVLARTEISRSTTPYSSGFESPCALAAALYWYERILHQLAEEHLQTQISRIEHFGTYACRNINGRAEARRSAHATARAIDISGFRLENGTIVTVLGDWGKDTPEGNFLRAARDEACRLFNPVLSPDYNAAHANHFHLELGGPNLCR